MEASTRDQLKAYLPEYLTAQGIQPGRPFCCLNPSHPDKHPSMRYDPRREAVHCFACGVDYDVFDLVSIEYGLKSFPEQAEKVEDLAGIQHAQRRTTPVQQKERLTLHNATSDMDTGNAHTADYLQSCRNRVHETDYFLGRGIGSTIMDKFQLGYDPAFTQGTGGQPWQAVILPTGEESFTARNTAAEADPRARIRKKGEAAFLGWRECFIHKAQSGNPEGTASDTSTATGRIFVTEGEFDALSLWEIGQSAISLGSVANAGKFLRKLKEAFPNSKEAPAILVSLDNDDAGRKASSELLEDLRQAGFRAYEVNLCGSYKDPNEALVQNREAFRTSVVEAEGIEEREAERAKKAYLSNSSAAYLEAFIGGIAASVNTEALCTGFPVLDDQLDGGLYEGLYVIGAISSLGKTSLLLQIADQLCMAGHDVLIFSLEMARTELMAKSISRHTLDICLREGLPTSLAKTGRGITDGKRYAGYSEAENHLIARAIEAYGQYAGHLFIHEGVGNIGVAQIREAILRHIEHTGRTPVVVVDYLQILGPHSDRATDKQNTDKAVLELKRISRDFKLPLLGISSFNRANYAAPVTMEAFKESGTIEYSSDVLIGLQLKGAGTADFDVQASKRENPRQVEVVILKNRNGPTGGKLTFRYYSHFNTFQSVGNAW